MSSQSSAKPTTKQKVVDELWDMLSIFIYLSFFFCALTAYSNLLLHKYDVQYLNYAFALINALVIAKVILIGELAHLGRKYERWPLLWSSITKAFLFCLLVFAFHLVEEMVKHVIHGERAASVFREVQIDELLSRTIVIFGTFIPLFAFRECRRVMGEEEFKTMFFKSPQTGK
jgi:hypothetical protein